MSVFIYLFVCVYVSCQLSTTTWKTPVGQRSRQASRLEGELQREEATGKRREARRKTGFAAAGTSSTSSTHDASGRSGTKPLASRNTSKANHPAVGVAKVSPGVRRNSDYVLFQE